jgi:predicted GH43/DUF377 family glycosyl hydrolase
LSPWPPGPFSTPQRILERPAGVAFDCPVAGVRIAWAAKDLFNPAAVVRDEKVCLLVRAEDHEGRYAGTSRIGLAESTDGRIFELAAEPVIFPDDDCWQAWEWPGGCEDPRVVESPEGGYVCAYTAFDGKVPSLFMASSDDLVHWRKHGPAFAGSAYVRRPSKSGAVITELKDGRLVAARIGGSFWMYWGEGAIYAAVSDDLVRWTPVEIEAAPERYLTWSPATKDQRGGWGVEMVTGGMGLHPIVGPRRGRFDSRLAEPGPPAVLAENGVFLIYNGGNDARLGDPAYAAGAYQPGLLVLDPKDPTAVIARPLAPFLAIDPAEADGQVGNVCFAEGLVAFKGEWLLYVGLADSRLGVSAAPMESEA